MSSPRVSNSYLSNNPDFTPRAVTSIAAPGEVIQVMTSGLSIPDHDYVELSYTGSNLTGVVYKTGGSSGATVGTLTLAYSGSNLTSVTKS